MKDTIADTEALFALMLKITVRDPDAVSLIRDALTAVEDTVALERPRSLLLH